MRMLPILVRTAIEFPYKHSPIPESMEFRRTRRIEAFLNHCHCYLVLTR